MELFKLQFPLDGFRDIEKLYFRLGCGATYNDVEKEIDFEVGSTATFDTYFNCFSVSKYLRYTCVSHASLEIELKGEFVIRLMARRAKDYHELRKERIEHIILDKADECVYQQSVNFIKKQKQKIDFNFSNELEWYEGIYYLELTALKSDAKFYGGRYITSVEPTRDIHIALSICTFKREDYVKANVNNICKELIESETSSVKDSLEIYVVDNGKTLQESLFHNPHVKLIYNKNYGGAGGFSRGMIEGYYHRDALTHVLVLDDDVTICPEAIAKTINFLRFTKKHYKDLYVAAGMLPLDNPTFQFEATSRWDGVYHNLKKMYLSDPVSLLYNEFEEHADYGSWYYQCIPISVIRDDNLPLPIFIKFDDMEYSIRNMKECLVMNGICIWHEAFDKKYSPYLDYYYTRNHLILNHLHKIGGGRIYDLKDIAKNVIRNCLMQRYDAAEMYIRGLHDYMRGIDFFKEIDDEELHKSIMGACTKMYTLEQLRKQGVLYYQDRYDNAYRHGEKKLTKIGAVLTLGGHLLPTCLLRHDIQIVDLNIGRPAMCFGYKQIFHWNPNDQKGFLTEMQRGRFFKIVLSLFIESIRYLVCAEKIANDYRTRVGEITSLSYWEKHLSIHE